MKQSRMRTRGRWKAAILSMFTIFLMLGRAYAEPYPSRPIKIIVPFLAGSATDVTARLMAKSLEEKLGVPVVIENKGGAGGNIGTALVARADPDGYTLLYSASGPLAVNKTLFAKLPYDPETDFAPISLIATLPNLLVVNPKNIPVKNVKDFISFLKATPGTVNVASIGIGSSQDLAAFQFELATGTKMTHVRYSGIPPILNDLLSGSVPISFINIPAVLGMVKTGQLQALAVTTKERSKLLPDVPTLHEEGLPRFESYAWFGFLAPKGTPPAIVERLNKEVVSSMSDPLLRDRMIKIGAEPTSTSPAEFKKFISAEVAKWRDIIQKANIPIVQ